MPYCFKCKSFICSCDSKKYDPSSRFLLPDLPQFGKNTDYDRIARDDYYAREEARKRFNNMAYGVIAPHR